VTADISESLGGSQGKPFGKKDEDKKLELRDLFKPLNFQIGEMGSTTGREGCVGKKIKR